MDEYRALLEACTVLGGYGPEFRTMIVFSAWTGVRIGELQALEWKDVDGDVIHIRRARRSFGLHPLRLEAEHGFAFGLSRNDPRHRRG